jgi:hypothetical protein
MSTGQDRMVKKASIPVYFVNPVNPVGTSLFSFPYN